MQDFTPSKSVASSLGETTAAKAINLVVTAVIVYFAISIGIMQMKTTPSPVLHSASSPAETVHI